MTTTTEPNPMTRIVGGVELPATGRWVIDPGHADIGFVGRHLKFTKVRGRFTHVDGFILVADDPNDTTVQVTIDMASVESGNPTRDDHLRSPDLFDVPAHPTATFRGGAEDWSQSHGRLTGDLTIKGVRRSVVLDVDYHGLVSDPWGSDRIVFSASGVIDREAFGINWNMALDAGGLLVSKQIELEFELEAIFQPESTAAV